MQKSTSIHDTDSVTITTTNMPSPPPGYTPLNELHKLRKGNMVSIIGRVLANPPGLISITDFTTRERFETEYDIVVNFDHNPNEWRPDQEPQVGDVVVLTNFKKVTGFEKHNPVLYSKRLMSKVVFYDQDMKSYSKFPRDSPPPDYSSNNPIYKYVSALIEDWQLDPRSGGGTQAAVQSYEMSLEDVFQKFDTSRFTTLKGEASELDEGLFQLTDAPGWKVQLEGYGFEDEMRQRCRDEHSRYVQLTHVRFKTRDIGSRKMFAKMTDRTSIDELQDGEKKHLKARLKGADESLKQSRDLEKNPQTPSSPISSPSPPFEIDRHSSDSDLDSEAEQMGELDVNYLTDHVHQSRESSPKTPTSRDKPEPETEAVQNLPPPSGQPRAFETDAESVSRDPFNPLSQDEPASTSREPRSSRDQHQQTRRLPDRDDDSEPSLTVPHHIPARKKIKSESPVTRTPKKTAVSQPLLTSHLSQAQPTQPAHISQSQSPLLSQLGPSFAMSDYAVPEIEEPFMVVSGVVEDAGLTDTGHFSFTVYCECVDKRFLVKIRKEDERDFLGNCKNNQETKLKVLNSWASLLERVKVNLIPDGDINERGEQEGWSVGNSLELQM